MRKGTGEVVRGEEKEKIGPNEKLTFTSDNTEKMVKTKEIAPPILINPAAQQQVALGSGGVTFSWTPVDNVRGYHLTVSRNQFFNAGSLVYDKVVTGEQLQ